MPDLRAALKSGRVLLMDGAMGSQLVGDADPGKDCLEAWSLTRPERVAAIHKGFVAAGAAVLLTNTFQAHPAHLQRHGWHERLGDIWQAGIDLARHAAGPDRFVLADLGPLAEIPPGLVARVLPFWRQADGLLLETVSDLTLLEAVARIHEQHADLPPLIFSFTFLRTESGRLQTITGWSPAEAAKRVKCFPLAALGANCGKDIGVRDMAEIVCAFRQETDLPLLARPNAGTPRREGARWVYPLSPRQLADEAHLLREAGATLIGGCCGTTPEHIAALRKTLASGAA
jgi:methionine synthase I (cobalamin-dependent)